jgi:hypothetical protein
MNHELTLHIFATCYRVPNILPMPSANPQPQFTNHTLRTRSLTLHTEICRAIQKHGALFVSILPCDILCNILFDFFGTAWGQCIAVFF